MNSRLRCAALKEQEGLRDLSLLPDLVDDLVYLDGDELEGAPEAAVLCAVWLFEAPEAASNLLRARGRKGLPTILVPRFKAGDLAPIIGAPSAVMVHAADFDTVEWQDGMAYRVPGVCVLKSALHSGKWAVASGLGIVVLSFRLHAAAGPIVLCTASVGSRAPGAKREEQRRLLEQILSETDAARPCLEPTCDAEVLAGPLADLDTYFRETGDRGAAVLLALIACRGDRKADVVGMARQSLGITLDPDEAVKMLTLLPEVSPEDLSDSLRKHGWSAYLKRVEEMLRTGELI